jgi:hypothetical protein
MERQPITTACGGQKAGTIGVENAIKAISTPFEIGKCTDFPEGSLLVV